LKLKLLICFFLVSFLGGCATSQPPSVNKPLYKKAHKKKQPGHTKPYKIKGKSYRPIASAKGFSQKGIASWYGKKFHGRKTANGEIYDMYAMTAAHKTLPIGTWVQVYNLKNNKTIKVRINDRGPFIEDRIIDLSYTGAKKLGMVKSGIAPVEIKAINKGLKSFVKNLRPGNYRNKNFTIQAGVFKKLKNARKLKKQLSIKYKYVYIKTYINFNGKFFKVCVGTYSNFENAVKLSQKLIYDGLGAFVIEE